MCDAHESRPRSLPMPEHAATNRPRRALSFRDLVLFYIVTGISLRWIATAATVGASAVVIWLIAWCAFYLPLALSVMELSSRYPQEGGLYVWSKRAFGEFPGFITGWTYWASNLPYYPAVLYFAASNALFIGPARWQSLSENRTYFLVFALLGLALGTFLNLIGLSVGKWLAQSRSDRHMAAHRYPHRDCCNRLPPVRLGHQLHGNERRPAHAFP